MKASIRILLPCLSIPIPIGGLYGLLDDSRPRGILLPAGWLSRLNDADRQILPGISKAKQLHIVSLDLLTSHPFMVPAKE
ncbi:hypothetical protein ABH904_002952 [Pseudomonas frederiksbergensis]